MKKIINKILKNTDRLIMKIFKWVAKGNACIPLKLLLMCIPLSIIILVYFFIQSLYNAIFKK